MPLHKVFVSADERSGESEHQHRIGSSNSPSVAGANFTRTPQELKREIATHLVTDNLNETSRDLLSIMLTSQDSHAAVVWNPRVQRINVGLQQARKIACELSSSLCTNPRHMSPQDIASHGPILALLSADRSNAILETACNYERHVDRATAFAGLWAAGGLLSDERSKFVLATLNLQNASARAVAMGGNWSLWGRHTNRPVGRVGDGLEHLKRYERSALVENIRSMDTSQARARAVAIGGIAPGFEHLKSEEVDDLVRMIWDPNHPKALGQHARLAISSLGLGLKYVRSDHLTEILKVISDPDHSHAPTNVAQRAWMMGGLGPGLEFFTPDERTDLFRMISEPNHPRALIGSPLIAEVIAGWGAGFGHFQPGERTELFKMISDPNHPRSLIGDVAVGKAISGMGLALKHLKPKERSELVKIICDPDHAKVLTDPTDMAEAISGMGKGLEHLKPDERSALVRATRSLKGTDQAIAIAGIGQGLGYLKPAERSSLLTAADQLSREGFEWADEQHPSDHSLAMSGLTTGVKNWTTDLLNDKGVVVALVAAPPNRGLVERAQTLVR
jgi:hypothetical protein